MPVELKNVFTISVSEEITDNKLDDIINSIISNYNKYKKLYP